MFTITWLFTLCVFMSVVSMATLQVRLHFARSEGLHDLTTATGPWRLDVQWMLRMPLLWMAASTILLTILFLLYIFRPLLTYLQPTDSQAVSIRVAAAGVGVVCIAWMLLTLRGMEFLHLKDEKGPLAGSVGCNTSWKGPPR